MIGYFISGGIGVLIGIILVLCYAVISAKRNFKKEDDNYIHVKLEKECMSCPRLRLETKDYGDIAKVYTCRYMDLCKEVHKRYEEESTKV